MIMLQIFLVVFLLVCALAAVIGFALLVTAFIEALCDGLRLPHESLMRGIHLHDAVTDAALAILSCAAVYAFIRSAIQVSGEAW